MKTYLVTGAAGFIGANYIKYLLEKKYQNDDIKVIVLDLLTYAGNLGTIKNDIDDKRCVFVRGDIRDRDLVNGLFADNDIDYVVNFAAESHVDRSIEDPQLFLSVNIRVKLGLQAKTKLVIPLGRQESVITRFLPTRFMARLEILAISWKPRLCALTAHIVHQKLVRICLYWLIMIPITCL